MNSNLKLAFVFLLFLYLLISCKSTEQDLKEKMIAANNYLDDEEYEKALLKANEILQIDSTLLNAYLFKGIVLVKLEKYSEAATLLERVVNSDTNNTHAYFNLGLANLFLEDYKKSIAFFSKALRTKESGGFLLDKKYGQENEIPFIEIVYWRGIASYYNDSIEQSISDFNTCINLNFKTGDSYLYQGYNFVKRNDLKNACICFGEALRHGNNDAAPFKQKYCR